MMGVMRRADLLLGEDSERPLINRLTFILSFFMLTTGYVFYYSFYGCPFELKFLKLEHKIEEEVKKKTFYENLLTIMYGEGQTENIAEEEKKWSEYVSDWWNDISGDGTKPTDMEDDSKPLEEIPYNNSIKVLFKSFLLKERETDQLEIMEIMPNQTNGSLKGSEPEENPWSLFSFNFASAASLPFDDKTEEETLNYFDSLENDKSIEEVKSSGVVLRNVQCDGKVTENIQPQIITAAE